MSASYESIPPDREAAYVQNAASAFEIEAEAVFERALQEIAEVVVNDAVTTVENNQTEIGKIGDQVEQELRQDREWQAWLQRQRTGDTSPPPDFFFAPIPPLGPRQTLRDRDMLAKLQDPNNPDPLLGPRGEVWRRMVELHKGSQDSSRDPS